MTAVFAPGGHYEYRDGTLYCENVNLAVLAREFGTPLYVYSKASILENFQTYQRALEDIDHKICYAVKANSNIAVLSLLAKAGANFDIVSAGDLKSRRQSRRRCLFRSGQNRGRNSLCAN